jgi:anaerobic selenocysteine-containing dehydrogenase
MMKLGLAGASDLVDDLMGGRIKGLLCAGTDLAACIPDQKILAALRKLEWLSLAAPLPCETSEHADITLPGAFWFEENGTVFSLSGKRTAAPAVVAPPRGALTNSALFRGLAETLDVAFDDRVVVAESLNDAPKVPVDKIVDGIRSALAAMPGVSQSDQFALLGVNDCTHFWDGSATRKARWPSHVSSEPALVVSVEAGKDLGLRSDQNLKVATAYSSVQLPAEISEHVSGRTALVSTHFAECRRLFGWASRNGGLATGPVAASVVRATSG